MLIRFYKSFTSKAFDLCVVIIHSQFKTKQMKKINVILCLILFSAIMNGCKKDEASSTYSYNVKMTDGPGPYEAVNIDLQGVEVIDSTGATVQLNAHSRIYNLLNFSNGVDTIIASGNLNVNTVKQVRLILGTNNSVVINHISYPLSTPSADQTGLKLNVNHTIQAGNAYTALLDFDANSSIVATGAGTYKLKPVVRTIETSVNGSIKGKISMTGILAFVTVTSASNATYSSNVTTTGDFMVKGLSSGVYSVTVTPLLPLLPVTKSNVTVTTSSTTDVGIITL